MEAAGLVLVAEWGKWPEAALERPSEALWIQAVRKEVLQGIKEHRPVSLITVYILKGFFIIFFTIVLY